VKTLSPGQLFRVFPDEDRQKHQSEGESDQHHNRSAPVSLSTLEFLALNDPSFYFLPFQRRHVAIHEQRLRPPTRKLFQTGLQGKSEKS
jgi:hypothetical protein